MCTVITVVNTQCTIVKYVVYAHTVTCTFPFPVPMYETTDVEACCLALASSAELLAQSVSFLDIEQKLLMSSSYGVPQGLCVEKVTSVFTETIPKMMDELDGVISCVSSVLQVGHCFYFPPILCVCCHHDVEV